MDHSQEFKSNESSINLPSAVVVGTGVIVDAGVFAAFTRSTSFISVVLNFLILRSAKI